MPRYIYCYRDNNICNGAFALILFVSFDRLLNYLDLFGEP